MFTHDDHKVSRTRRLLSSNRFRALVALGMVLGVGGVSTLAAWTSSSTATSGQITTGSVHVLVNGTQNYNFSALSFADMRPADSKAAVVEIQNPSAGAALPLNYSVSSHSTGSLANYLAVTAKFGGTAAKKCTDGTGGVTALPLTATGSQAITQGDRPLAVGASETLCVAIQMLPTAPPSAVRNLNATFDLNITAKA